MTERHIRYALTIAREGSITAARRKLHVSQLSVPQTVKLIECDLGAEILNQNTIPLSLTSAGRKYKKMVDIRRSFYTKIEKNNVETRLSAK